MMEDLQQAYAAYQQALYHLRDPKASGLPLRLYWMTNSRGNRNPNYGMVLGSCMIAMALWNMPKRPSRR